ncbi:MAG: 23S rRNA (adenine(1618)-N(6))-methyltransferase RlmF [Proteobacteria bacterium]|nr:23S rRNA (adenine(1618)-N(6))-methyltransferase RlmF [Pseudomonadota bacterium]
MKNKPAAKGRVTPVEKLHSRNPHRGRYDFRQLIENSPELAAFVSPNAYGDESIDFTDPLAVRALNRALLVHHYGIKGWDIPAQYLCPPIPGRADYLHHLADLLDQSGAVTRGARVLDIGTGANCIYPLIGHCAYGWQFVGTDIDRCALENAQRILDANPELSGAIELRLQISGQAIFKGIIKPGEMFDLALCNPPFHASPAEAHEGTQRKWKNLGKEAAGKPVLNFGGQGTELWCRGGEAAFVCRMIEESAEFKSSCLWFTSLISKSASLPAVYRALKKVAVQDYRTIEMAQGQKISRFVAWTFHDVAQRQAWRSPLVNMLS